MTRKGYVHVPGFGEVREGLAKALRRQDYQTEVNQEHNDLKKSELRVGRFIRGMFTRLGAVKGFATGASVDFIYHTVDYAANRSSSFRLYEIAAVVGTTAAGAVMSGRENVLEREADDIEVAAIGGDRPASSERPPDVPEPQRS